MKILKGAMSFVLAALVLTGLLYFAMRYQLERPAVGGNFTLQGSHGPVSLRDLSGKSVVLYFGYTSCPAACPMAMSKLGQVIKKLPTAVQEAIVPVFVSVDYKRDTPAKVDQYAKYFVKNAVGLTGTKEQIDKAVELYGTSYTFEKSEGSAFGYSVAHGSDFYLIDRNGKFEGTLSTEANLDEIEKKIQEIL